jgi:hypothetical protein
VGVAVLMLLDLGRVTVGAFVVRPATQLDQLSGRLMATKITLVGQDFPLRDCSRHQPIGSTPQAKALIARDVRPCDALGDRIRSLQTQGYPVSFSAASPVATAIFLLSRT